MNVDIERTDEKNTLRVSAFVIWHQETVKLALKKLIACSKVTPEVMDKQLDLATREFEQHLIRLGKKVADILELEIDIQNYFKYLVGLNIELPMGKMY